MAVTRYEGDYSMDRGAVAVLDALGFRGIWKDNPLRILSNLSSHRSQLEEFIKSRWKIHDPPDDEVIKDLQQYVFDQFQVECQYFSDTILISCRLTFPTIMEEAEWGTEEFFHMVDLLSLEIVGEMAALTYFMSAVSNPPLCYRGSISVGEFAILEGFGVGPAIDEAAEFMNDPQGAIIWMTPSAERAYTRRKWMRDYMIDLKAKFPDQFQNLQPPEFVFVPYVVPLKNGATLSAHVVDVLFPTGKKQDAVIAGVEKRMSADALDVRLKLQNTLALLNHLKSVPRTENWFPVVSP